MCYCVYTCVCVCTYVCVLVCVLVCVCVCVWCVCAHVKLIAECKPTKMFLLTRVSLNGCNTYTFMKLNFAYKNNESCQHPQYIYMYIYIISMS